MNRELLLLHRCGILPSLQAHSAMALGECVAALGAQGFPCVEIDCAPPWGDPAWGEPELTAIIGENTGVAIGVRVRTGEQAAQALEAGARWIALPEGVAPPPMGERPLLRDAAGFAPAVANQGMPAAQAYCISGDTPLDALPPCERAVGEDGLPAFPQGALIVACEAEAAVQRAWLGHPRVLAVRRTRTLTPDTAQAQAAALRAEWVAALGFTIAHIGVNAQGDEPAREIARLFAQLLGVPYRPGEVSDFAGTLIEVMKRHGRGHNGHIGFGTADLARGLFFASRAGFAFDPQSRKDDPEGRAMLYYLQGEIGGFAVHLIQT